MKNFKMFTCYPNSVIVAHAEVEIWVFVQSHVTRWQLSHQHLGRSVPWTGWSCFLFTRQAIIENIIRRTVKDEAERHLSPSSTQKKRKSETGLANLLDKIHKGDHIHEDKTRKVHIKRKRFCFVRNQEYVVPQNKGGGFHFFYLPLDATVDTLSRKAIDVFFSWRY